jgi:hypothetical protein
MHLKRVGKKTFGVGFYLAEIRNRYIEFTSLEQGFSNFFDGLPLNKI